MLLILARSMSDRRILEMGTLGAYSTIWLACALPDAGEMLTPEINQSTLRYQEETSREREPNWPK